MNIGSKLQELRRSKGLSQEELADIMGVSRQSVSKWEMDNAYPETEKLIKLAEFYHVTIDSLIKGEDSEIIRDQGFRLVYHRFHYEYKSKKRLFGMPLVHINVGQGFYVSKGVFSIGTLSTGIFSIGVLSFGILSIGVLSIGLMSLGAFALGLLLAVGSISIGSIALGAIAVGLFTIGGISIGYFSYGALCIAKYVAIGDNATGLISIGTTKAQGTYAFLSPYNKDEIISLIHTHVPTYWNILIKWIIRLL